MAVLTSQIQEMECWIEELARTEYPETAVLTQVPGVGNAHGAHLATRPKAIRGLQGEHVRSGPTWVWSRDVHDSGESSPQLRMTKAGDVLLRTHLVQSAHYILGPFGPDSDLRRWGLALAERGGSNAKKRALVAVARKLAVLLHRLWSTGEVYEPLRTRSSDDGTDDGTDDDTDHDASKAA